VGFARVGWFIPASVLRAHEESEPPTGAASEVRGHTAAPHPQGAAFRPRNCVVPAAAVDAWARWWRTGLIAPARRPRSRRGAPEQPC
jgi:hypothetical protein